jgi:hypothetical protein
MTADVDRLVDRVLDEIKALQTQLLGPDADAVADQFNAQLARRGSRYRLERRTEPVSDAEALDIPDTEHNRAALRELLATGLRLGRILAEEGEAGLVKIAPVSVPLLKLKSPRDKLQ